MGAATATAAVPVAPAVGDRPSIGDRHRNQQSGGYAGQVGRGFRAIPLAKTVRSRHGKRDENHTVMTTADDLGGRR